MAIKSYFDASPDEWAHRAAVVVLGAGLVCYAPRAAAAITIGVSLIAWFVAYMVAGVVGVVGEVRRMSRDEAMRGELE